MVKELRDTKADDLLVIHLQVRTDINHQLSMPCVFGFVAKMSSPYPNLPVLLSYLICRSFIVLCFVFRSVIHFEFIFVSLDLGPLSILSIFCSLVRLGLCLVCLKDCFFSITLSLSLPKVS